MEKTNEKWHERRACVPGAGTEKHQPTNHARLHKQVRYKAQTPSELNIDKCTKPSKDAERISGKSTRVSEFKNWSMAQTDPNRGGTARAQEPDQKPTRTRPLDPTRRQDGYTTGRQAGRQAGRRTDKSADAPSAESAKTKRGGERGASPEVIVRQSPFPAAARTIRENCGEGWGKGGTSCGDDVCRAVIVRHQAGREPYPSTTPAAAAAAEVWASL